MERLGKERFGRMDLQQKGYITRREYVQMRHSTVGDQLAGAVFDAMDTDKKGKVTNVSLFDSTYIAIIKSAMIA